MTLIDMASEIFPGKPNDWLEFVVWNRTAHPFSDVCQTRLHLLEFRDAIEDCPEGRHLCDLCNRIAKPDSWCCDACDPPTPLSQNQT